MERAEGHPALVLGVVPASPRTSGDAAVADPGEMVDWLVTAPSDPAEVRAVRGARPDARRPWRYPMSQSTSGATS